jgi:proline dehydrogenase
MITIGVMTRISKAQEIFLEDICQLWGPETLSKEDIGAGLKRWNIAHTSEDLERLFSSLKFKENNGETVSRVERYANAHLFPLYHEKRNPFLSKMALQLGVTPSDASIFETFIRRVLDITTLSLEKNCLLYVDAEQSYMQRGLDSIAHQLTHHFNRGTKTIIMNGFQQYLKRMSKVVPLEIEASKRLGYNLGVKLIRGAYMNEERTLARQGGYESPVHETIEDTHNCYNTNLRILTASFKPNDRIFVGSHNLESVELARQLINGNDFNGRVSLA